MHYQSSTPIFLDVTITARYGSFLDHYTCDNTRLSFNPPVPYSILPYITFTKIYSTRQYIALPLPHYTLQDFTLPLLHDTEHCRYNTNQYISFTRPLLNWTTQCLAITTKHITILYIAWHYLYNTLPCTTPPLLYNTPVCFTIPQR